MNVHVPEGISAQKTYFDNKKRVQLKKTLFYDRMNSRPSPIAKANSKFTYKKID